jgi:RHH-type transcriptional regulator, rel operon repressor / antitoxin RelB
MPDRSPRKYYGDIDRPNSNAMKSYNEYNQLTQRGRMSPNTITLDLDPEKRQALDQIAHDLYCDDLRSIEDHRTDLIKQAIDLYLQTHQWQTSHILEGIRQADAGNFATEAEVTQAFAKWRS